MDISKSMLQQIEGWRQQKVTKLVTAQLEGLKESYTQALTTGVLLDSPLEQARAVGRLEVIEAVLNPEILIIDIAQVDRYDDDKLQDDNSVIDEEEVKEGDYYGDSRDQRKIYRRDRS